MVDWAKAKGIQLVYHKATLDYPARLGSSLADDIRKWCQRWYELVKPKLQPYFTPLPPGAEGLDRQKHPSSRDFFSGK